MSPLLTLPAELRLRIYDHLPDLAPNRSEIVTAYSRLTPAISRVNRCLRRETLAAFAAHSRFDIRLDDAGPSRAERIACLLDALGQGGGGGDPNDEDAAAAAAAAAAANVSRIRSLQISRHWSIPQPQRWQGHIGFYVRIERRKNDKHQQQEVLSNADDAASHSSSGPTTGSFRPEWNAHFVRPATAGDYDVTAGTYPEARDPRGMRHESVELLVEIVRQRLRASSPSTSAPAPASASTLPSSSRWIEREEVRARRHRRLLRRADVDFVIRAMDVVAWHPIATYEIEQAESARRRQRETWSSMEQQLRALLLDE